MHIGTTLHKVFDRLTELAQSDSMIPGLSTGLRDLDTKINGLNKSDLLLVAARPAMGKSAFALNIGVNVAKKYKKTVAIFNLEMSREQLAMRLLANESFVELQKLATGKLSEEEWTKLCMASAALSQTDIRIDDNPHGINSMWRTDAILAHVGLQKISETAITTGNIGYAVNSFTRLGEDGFHGNLNYKANHFGQQEFSLNLRGSIANGWYYSASMYQDFDPGTFKVKSSQYQDRTQIYKLALTKRYNGNRGEFTALFLTTSKRTQISRKSS